MCLDCQLSEGKWFIHNTVVLSIPLRIFQIQVREFVPRPYTVHSPQGECAKLCRGVTKCYPGPNDSPTSIPFCPTTCGSGARRSEGSLGWVRKQASKWFNREKRETYPPQLQRTVRRGQGSRAATRPCISPEAGKQWSGPGHWHQMPDPAFLSPGTCPGLFSPTVFWEETRIQVNLSFICLPLLLLPEWRGREHYTCTRQPLLPELFISLPCPNSVTSGPAICIWLPSRSDRAPGLLAGSGGGVVSMCRGRTDTQRARQYATC
jgi:hypothetical protein